MKTYKFIMPNGKLLAKEMNKKIALLEKWINEHQYENEEETKKWAEGQMSSMLRNVSNYCWCAGGEKI